MAIAHKFVDEYVRPEPDRDFSAFEDSNLSELLATSAQRANTMGHAARWETCETGPDVRECLFQPKDQVKVKTSPVDQTKVVPQGISAWPATWMVEIGAATKVLSDHLECNLMQHVVSTVARHPCSLPRRSPTPQTSSPSRRSPQ